MTWHGRLGRAPYAAVGVVLVAVKYAVDRLLAYAFGRSWRYFDYWNPSAIRRCSISTGDFVEPDRRAAYARPR